MSIQNDLKSYSEECYTPYPQGLPYETEISTSIFTELKSTVQKVIASFCQFIANLFTSSSAQTEPVVIGRQWNLQKYTVAGKECEFWYAAPIYGTKP